VDKLLMDRSKTATIMPAHIPIKRAKSACQLPGQQPAPVMRRSTLRGGQRYGGRGRVQNEEEIREGHLLDVEIYEAHEARLMR
jgi:hypothetical protein